ncbi:rRNA-processing protein cgr1 [Madurella fahalii]|uniref:rRNA-processing protein cgr1 n=1 Tax=Madurella fahalii TaxID=1157608 RepID=A0ABQ0GRY8_9PEZI
MAKTNAIPEKWQAGAPYLDMHCSLGEGPYYEPTTETLRFVDIKKKQLHTVSVTDGPSSLKTLQFEEAVTVTADVEGRDPSETVLIGAKQGLALLDRKSGKYEYLTKLPEVKPERIRPNDGAADPKGRFWLGTMTDFGLGPFQPEGSLYLFPNGRTVTRSRAGLTIPNSVGWSPDGRTMYFTHSTARMVFAWDFAAEDGSLSNERVFYRHDGPGEPDGFRVDVDGNLWHAVYGEGRVLKISPEGRLVGEIILPTRNITCVEFVGEELFITTAGDDEGEGESKRLGGGVWRVNVGVRGTERFRFRLE